MMPVRNIYLSDRHRGLCVSELCIKFLNIPISCALSFLDIHNSFIPPVLKSEIFREKE